MFIGDNDPLLSLSYAIFFVYMFVTKGRDMVSQLRFNLEWVMACFVKALEKLASVVNIVIIKYRGPQCVNISLWHLLTNCSWLLFHIRECALIALIVLFTASCRNAWRTTSDCLRRHLGLISVDNKSFFSWNITASYFYSYFSMLIQSPLTTVPVD